MAPPVEIMRDLSTPPIVDLWDVLLVLAVHLGDNEISYIFKIQ